jgi:acetylornithine/succinyldiaminopimelate/putrescine aminotransferase
MARKNVHQRSNNEFSKKVFAKTITPNEDVNQMWDRLQMHPGDTNPVLISSTIFSKSFTPLAEKLAPHWEKIVNPSQANVVYRISSEAIELAVSIARKYANKCNKLWANQKGERSE